MGENYRQNVQEVLDSYPNEETFLEFDDFFVGGAYKHQLPDFAASQKPLTWQLTGVTDVEALKRGEVRKEDFVEAENDLDAFISEKVDVLDADQYEKLFMAMKLRAFRMFNFLDIKSAALGDIPIKEKDLVLNEDDYYIMDYLKGTVSDYYAVASIATLLAYENMGIYSVRFRQQDDCPICKALDGVFFETRSLISLLGTGNHVSHRYCDCQLVPVIFREMYAGPLEGYLDLEETRHGAVTIRNAPREMEVELRQLSEQLDVECIEFVDMKDHLRENLEIADIEGIVAVLEDGVLSVHNSYVGSHGPLDFLREFAEAETLPDRISPASLEDAEIYLMGGRRVAKKQGKYWDPETGERLK